MTLDRELDRALLDIARARRELNERHDLAGLREFASPDDGRAVAARLGYGPVVADDVAAVVDALSRQLGGARLAAEYLEAAGTPRPGASTKAA